MGESGASRPPDELADAVDAIRRFLAWLESSGTVDGTDAVDLEAGFVRHAAAYSQRKGLSYQDWRQAGVPVDVLTRAGILEFNG